MGRLGRKSIALRCCAELQALVPLARCRRAKQRLLCSVAGAARRVAVGCKVVSGINTHCGVLISEDDILVRVKAVCSSCAGELA